MDLLTLKKKNNALIESERHLIESINFNCPYFLLINGDNEILEHGVNYLKSINGIAKNKLFTDFFTWESHFSGGDLLSEKQTYSKLLFFNSLASTIGDVETGAFLSFFIDLNPVIPPFAITLARSFSDIGIISVVRVFNKSESSSSG